VLAQKRFHEFDRFLAPCDPSAYSLKQFPAGGEGLAIANMEESLRFLDRVKQIIDQQFYTVGLSNSFAHAYRRVKIISNSDTTCAAQAAIAAPTLGIGSPRQRLQEHTTRSVFASWSQTIS
jgi:hypothetical protein